MSKNIFIGVLILGVIVLLYFILHEPKPTDSHKSEHTEVVANNDTLKAHDAMSARIIDSLKKDNRKLDSANKQLISGQAQTERKLNLKAGEVKNLVQQIREYNKDTGYFGHLLDSLKGQVESLSYLITQYEQYADSINNVNAALKGNYEAMVLENDKKYTELKDTYDKLLKAYNDLFADYAKSQKTVRHERLKTKIGILLGLLSGGAAGRVLK